MTLVKNMANNMLYNYNMIPNVGGATIALTLPFFVTDC